jgi:hypothetical protein
LILSDNGEQLWARSFQRNNTASGIFEIQNEIVRSVLTAVGGYYGAIFRDVLKAPHSNRANGIEIYDAIYWYYHFQKNFSEAVLEKAIGALEAAVKADPHYALAWAMLGFAEQLEFLETVPGEWSPREHREAIETWMLEAARATCDFYIDHAACADGIPYWDTGAP